MTKSIREQAERRRTLRPHPVRDQIVDAMRTCGTPISPTQLAAVTGTSLGSTAYHVRTLRDAGVVVLAEEGRVRGAVEHFYALVEDTEAELNDPLVGLQRLCGMLTLANDGGQPRPIVLDEVGRKELQKVLDGMRPRVQKIVRSVATREADSDPRA